MPCESYAWGNCTWGVCEYTGWIPPGWGDAKDWAYQAITSGFAVTPEPTVGAVVVYGADPAYSELGHVGVVTRVYSGSSFEVHEMNAVGLGVWDDRTSSDFDVLGFIVPPGGSIGGGPGEGAGGPGADFDSFAAGWSQLGQLLSVDFPKWAIDTFNIGTLIQQLAQR